MIHEDWLMRQIEALIRFIVSVLLNKEFPGYVIDDESQVSQTDMLHSEIMKLLSDKKICEAENLLYRQLDTGDMKHLELALDFYHRVNLFGDAELEKCNFSREEVKEGLHGVLKQFGLQDLLSLGENDD